MRRIHLVELMHNCLSGFICEVVEYLLHQNENVTKNSNFLNIINLSIYLNSLNQQIYTK